MSDRASKYTDLVHIYSQCSGPGGLRMAEFLADNIGLQPGMRVLDIGVFRGIQTCFLAKEYGCNMVAIDPWTDDFGPDTDGRPYIEHMLDNARDWGVEDRVMGLQLGMPDSKFADNTFDAAYSSTAFEMIRGIFGAEQYFKSVQETLRVLKPGALFGMAEPMHCEGPPPPDLDPLVSAGDLPFKQFIVTPEATAQAFAEAGFEVLDFGHVPDARDWWEEFAEFDSMCRADPDSLDRRIVATDAGRWLTVGYVIARKPD